MARSATNLTLLGNGGLIVKSLVAVKQKMEQAVRAVPPLKYLLSSLRKLVRKPPPLGSPLYWEERYKRGGTSGAGSFGELARYKADYIHSVVKEFNARSVIEFGCGDGNQLSLMRFPSYLGFDVSATALSRCRAQLKHDPNVQVRLLSEYRGERADLTLSIEVLFHLVSDRDFAEHMRLLFDASTHYVLVFSSNTNSLPGDTPGHVRHRCFTDWVAEMRPGWRLLRAAPNPFPELSFSSFYLFTLRSQNLRP